VESIQDTVQTVQALKAASSQMKGAMKGNKELNLSFIDNLQEELADMAVRGLGRRGVHERSAAGNRTRQQQQ
jgi:charged multivesicular body protein 5